ncbi:glycerophosphoinositol permease [Diatrype stigma]|uniref:Glycerophosphoinositol permease n=1 Tax=Diatrype stigma TaxID=117547 RepID=A0AAN9YUH7_9PEZI
MDASLEQRPFWETIWPVLACGAGLFSDGYVNNVIGSVVTVLKLEYADTYTNSGAAKYVSDIAFAGTVVGQLLFGVLADRWSRTGSLLVSTVILIIFTALATGSYYHGDAVGMFNILTAWRFFIESSDVVAAAAQNKYYSTIWRTSLGIGTVFPLILFVLRLRLKEPEEFSKHSMKYARTPYALVWRFYGWRLFVVCLIWFIYDFSTYSFGIYSSTILSNIYGDGAPLTTVFGWNTVINLFYLPGTIFGAFVSDWLGPRYTLVLGVTLQAIVGFIMAGVYAHLSQPSLVGAFAVVYGIFLTLGELGPGNNIGLLAAKTCATGIRGQYYGFAAAVGKIGAFVGTWVFPYIQAAGGPDAVATAQYPFFVSASLCVLSGALALLCLPNVGQDTIALEDARFREYLESRGWDTRQLGLRKGEGLPGAGEVDVESSGSVGAGVGDAVPVKEKEGGGKEEGGALPAAAVA